MNLYMTIFSKDKQTGEREILFKKKIPSISVGAQLSDMILSGFNMKYKDVDIIIKATETKIDE